MNSDSFLPLPLPSFLIFFAIVLFCGIKVGLALSKRMIAELRAELKLLKTLNSIYVQLLAHAQFEQQSRRIDHSEDPSDWWKES